jgi:MFS transporter, MHS family, alpha-ketoglutarate permease
VDLKQIKKGHMEDTVQAGTETRSPIRAIVGAAAGNLVEWYDFYAYSFTSLYFASAFFPAGDRTTQLLNTAGIFAAGFLIRPFGGWLFGRIADRLGRRISLDADVDWRLHQRRSRSAERG